MTSPTTGSARSARPVMARRETRVGLLILVLGLALWWACRFHAAALPAWLPWDFSPLWYAGFAATIWSYIRGLAICPQPRWRIAIFAAGVLLLWGVLQTRYEYLSQHMFFLNRLQHVAMHHLGPFLIAIAWPWKTLRAGLPAATQRWLDHPAWVIPLRLFQQPAIACIVFVGLILLWLIPSVHFAAMINPLLYQVMNWSMVLDGLLFWSVVLDPRGTLLARNSFVARAIMGVGVMFPQIVIGAVLAFSRQDLYTFYAWCGRLYPTIGPVADQHIGGLIIWIPPAMMSALSLLLVLNAARLDDERQERPARTATGGISSTSWTGR